MNELLTAALDYAARGWPVFPVKPRAKLPLGRLVPHGLKDASTDPDQIRSWWNEAPNANIGLVTGVAFDVIDIDSPEGLAALVEASGGEEMEWGPETLTGSGGAHLLQQVTGLGNKTGFLPGVDYRGKGGYIVAPPSIHPTGKRYEWCRDAHYEDLPLWPNPEWLMKLLNPPVKQWTPAVINGTGNGDRMSAYARRALEAEVGRVTMAPSGTRNDALNKAAFALGQLVAAGALSEIEVASSLARAAHGVGLGEIETTRSIASGLRSGGQQPRTMPAPA